MFSVFENIFGRMLLILFCLHPLWSTYISFARVCIAIFLSLFIWTRLPFSKGSCIVFYSFLDSTHEQCWHPPGSDGCFLSSIYSSLISAMVVFNKHILERSNPLDFPFQLSFLNQRPHFLESSLLKSDASILNFIERFLSTVDLDSS